MSSQAGNTTRRGFFGRLAAAVGAVLAAPVMAQPAGRLERALQRLTARGQIVGPSYEAIVGDELGAMPFKRLTFKGHPIIWDNELPDTVILWPERRG